MEKITGSYTVTLDDDPTVSMIVEHALNIKNFSYYESKKLIEDASKLSPLGVIVDVHLDGECGLDIIPTLRSFWPAAAIIVVTMDESAEVIQQAFLLYISDMGLLAAANNPHGVNFLNENLQVASLDHAMWFHRKLDLNDWILYSIDSPISGNARGYSRGAIYTQDGILLASCAQEGLIRLWPAKS